MSDPSSGWVVPPEQAPPDPAPSERTVADVPWNIADAAFVWLITFGIVVLLGQAVLSLLERSLSEQAALGVYLQFANLTSIAVVLVYVRSRYPGSVGRLRGPAPMTWVRLGIAVVAGLVALVAFIFGVGNLLRLITEAMNGQVPQVQEQFREMGQDRDTAGFLVLGAVILGPIAEELFYRGLLFTALRKRFDLWPALGISGLVFGLVHFQTSWNAYLYVVLVIVPLGMFLAYLYDRTRSLFVPITAHLVFNLVQVVDIVRKAI